MPHGVALLVNMWLSANTIVLSWALFQTVNTMWMPPQTEQFYKNLTLPKVTLSTSRCVTRKNYVVQLVSRTELRKFKVGQECMCVC